MSIDFNFEAAVEVQTHLNTGLFTSDLMFYKVPFLKVDL